MNTIENALQIVNLFNTAAPGIASLIMIIRRTDGTVTVAALLDEADASFSSNISAAQKWLAERGWCVLPAEHCEHMEVSLV